MKVFILILILGLTLQIYILPQYSSIEVKENSYIYLDLSNYEKDIIYIDIDIYRNGTQKSVNDETQYYLNTIFFLILFIAMDTIQINIT